MTTSEILELVRAGYTKEEIDAFEMPAKTEEKTEEKTETKAEEKTERKDVPATDSEKAIGELTARVADLANIIRDMQNNNARTATSGETKAETADSVIRDFFGMKEGR